MTTPEEAKALRQSTGLSQDKFAAILGVTGACVSRWERGQRKIGHLTAAGIRAETAKYLCENKS